MFREYRIFKLVLIALLIVFFVKQLTEKVGPVEGFSWRPSYYPDEKAGFSFIGNADEMLMLKLTALNNDYEESVSLKSSLVTNDSVLLRGIGGEEQQYQFSPHIASGIYLINEEIPFVIKSREVADITVVYPYANNLIFTSYNKENITDKNYVFTNMKRPNKVDPVSLSMRSFFNAIEEQYRVNYITDLDLEEANQYEKSKVLLIYGDLLYSSPEMRENVLNFIHNGGHVLLASEYFLNNDLHYDRAATFLTLNKKMRDAGHISSERNSVSLWELKHKYINEVIGISYGTGGKPELNDGYEIYESKHPVFKNIGSNTVPITGKLFNGVRENIDSVKKELPANNIKVLAGKPVTYNNLQNITGIIEIQLTDSSGVLLSLGTKEWFGKYNYSKEESLRTITKNAINYLMNL